jgi:uncharacterized protein (TIGR02452 family)
MDNAQIAKGTIEAITHGAYANKHGKSIDIATMVTHCTHNTAYFEPDALAKIHADVLAVPAPYAEMHITLSDETSLQGAYRLVASKAYQKVAVLNFASAKNPGGGFLGGARAQEESLARSSALYHSLLTAREYYDFHRKQGTALYSDRMIYSPACPVFRTDDGNWLDAPYLVDVLTSAAPNAGAVAQNEPNRTPEVLPTLQQRGKKVLALAAHQKAEALVLGAWGCGVFRNDPSAVADFFTTELGPNGNFAGRFKEVLFAVYDTSKTRQVYKAFAEHFTPLG